MRFPEHEHRLSALETSCPGKDPRFRALEHIFAKIVKLGKHIPCSTGLKTGITKAPIEMKTHINRHNGPRLGSYALQKGRGSVCLDLTSPLTGSPGTRWRLQARTAPAGGAKDPSKLTWLTQMMKNHLTQPDA
jgi:hypothetical protein